MNITLRVFLWCVSMFEIRGVLALAIDDPSKLIFNKYDRDALWPLPQPDDVGCLIEHGLHCLEVVKGHFEVNVTDDMTDDSPRMHVEHCSQVVHRVLRFLESNPNYNVPNNLCDDYKTVTHWFNRHMIRNQLIFLYWGYKEHAMFTDKELRELDQYEMFARISGANFGNLLFKDWKGDKLTKSEAEIIEKLNSDEAVRFAAFGIYCTHGGVNAKNVLLQAQQKNHGSMPYGS